MRKAIEKIIGLFKYIFFILPGMKIVTRIRNRFTGPTIYDVFYSSKSKSICVIAPYYSANVLTDSYCVFNGNASVKCESVYEPEYSCLILLYAVPDHISESVIIFNIEVKRRDKVYFCGTVGSQVSDVRHRLSIVTLIKYEHMFLLEWIDHHLKQGVDHFYIYDNNSADSLVKKALADYVDSGIVTYINWPYPYKLYNYHMKPYWPTDCHMYTQISQINHALYKFGGQNDRMLFCDVDEYFYSPDRSNLISAILSYGEIPAIRVHGYRFGGDVLSIRSLDKKGVRCSFTKRELSPDSATKLIVIPDHVLTLSVHDILDTHVIPVDIDENRVVFNHYVALGWKKRVDDNFARDVEDKRITIYV